MPISRTFSTLFRAHPTGGNGGAGPTRRQKLSPRPSPLHPAVGVVLLVLAGTFSAPANLRAGEPDPPRYLVIHLDGVSSRVFMHELEAGNLENLRRAFTDAGIIPHGITYFPPLTAPVVTRLRHATALDEGEILGLEAYDPATGENRGKLGVLLHYAASIPRRARSSFLYGLPYMDPLGGLALWNVPEKVEQYGAMEFYWFGTDTAGHMRGEEALRRSLRRFDRYAPRLFDNLPEDVNVVIYADHGMTFGETRDHDEELRSRLGSRIRRFAYPNVYLHDPDERTDVARELVSSTSQDLAFVQETEDLVVGFHSQGRFELQRNRRGIRYRHDGSDPLGYDALGHAGEPLAPDEWLALTHDSRFPYTPVRILELMDNPRAGDVVTTLNSPSPRSGPWAFAGNHQGLTSEDMAVPVLVRGPELEHLRGRTFVRLEDILDRAGRGALSPRPPARERHTLRVWLDDGSGSAGRTEVAFSPRYRLRLGGEVGEGAITVPGELPPAWGHDRRAWAMVDVTSGYLSRLWLGMGVARREGSSMMGLARYELRVRDLGIEAQFSTGHSTRLDLFYRLHPAVELRIRDFGGVGMGIRF